MCIHMYIYIYIYTYTKSAVGLLGKPINRAICMCRTQSMRWDNYKQQYRVFGR